MSSNENSALQVLNDITIYNYYFNREGVSCLCWQFEHVIDLVEKCHILEPWVDVLFSVTRLDSFNEIEASGTVGILGSVLSSQMLNASNMKPAVAAYSMLRLFSSLGFQAESLHGKDFHWHVGEEYNFLFHTLYKVIQTVVIR